MQARDEPGPAIPRQIGRFEIRCRLGGGAFGAVYRAYDPVLDREVALKVPRAAALEDPQARARFLREPKAVAQLRHPSIVPVYDAGSDGALCYIASAYIEGRTLAALIQEDRPAFRRAAEIVRAEAENQRKRAEAERQRAQTALDQAAAEQARAKEAGQKAMEAARAAEAQRQRGDLERARAEKDSYIYFSRIASAHQKALQGQLAAAQELLDACPAALRHWEWGYLKQLCESNVRVFRGHGAAVSRIAFHPEGREIASAGLDRLLKVWDFETGREVRSLGPTESVPIKLLYSPDGKWLAWVGSAAKVWDAADGKERFAFQVEKLHDAAFSADGKELVAVTGDLVVRTWEMPAGAERESMSFPLNVRPGNLTMRLDPAARWVACGAGTTVRIRERATGREHRTLNSALGIKTLVFSPDGEYLVVGGSTARDPQTLKFYKIADGTELWPEKRGGYGDRYSVRGPRNFGGGPFTLSPDGKAAASAGPFGVELFDVETRTLLLQFRDSMPTAKLERASADSARFSPDGKWLAAGCTDGSIRLRELRVTKGESRVVQEGEPLGNGGGTLAFSPDGKWLIAGSGIWDAATGKAVLRTDGPPPESAERPLFNPSRKIAFSPNGRKIAAAASSAVSVSSWDPKTGRWSQGLSKRLLHVRAIAFTADSRRLVLASPTGVKVWDPEEDRQVLETPIDAAKARCMALSVAPKPLVAAAIDDTVKVWDAATGAEQFTLNGHKAKVSSLVFNPEGTRLASGSSDRTIRIWELTGGTNLLTLQGLEGSVSSLAYSPDGKRLVTGGDAGCLRLWDGATGYPILVLAGTGAGAVAFSPDSLRIASAGGRLLLWDAAPWAVPPAAEAPRPE